MKKKKQIKRILAVVTIVAIILGGWIILKPSELWAHGGDNKEKVVKNIENKGFLGDYPPLSSFSKWKDAITSSIPAEFSFSPLLTDGTDFKIVEGLEKMGNRYVFKDLSAKIKHVLIVSNVGFYGGEEISIKITVIPSVKLAPGAEGDYNSIYVTPEEFLAIKLAVPQGYDEKDGPLANVTYEFFKDSSCTDPIKVKGYFNFNNMNNKGVRLSSDNIINILSAGSSPSGYHPLPDEELTVLEEGEFTSILSSLSPGTSYDRLQNQITVIYGQPSSDGKIEGVDKFTWDWLRPSIDYPTGEGGEQTVFFPNGETIAKIDMPVPQGTGAVIDSIVEKATEATEATYNMIPYQFVQQIPYEMLKTLYWKGSLQKPPLALPEVINNQNQAMTWEIKTPASSGVIKPSTADDAFKVTNELQTGKEDDNSNGLFDVNIQGLNTVVTPKTNPPTGNNFYNHFYTFKEFVEIDYNKQVTLSDLQPKDGKGEPLTDKGNYYLPKTSSVSLTTTNPDKDYAGNTFTTWINFAANVEYQRYALAPGKIALDGTETRIDAINTADSDTLTKLGITQPLITHEAPIPTIAPAGYIPAKNTDGTDIIVYEIPQVDETVNNPKQLQLTGAAAGATGAKNIVKLYYRSVNAPYNVEIKVVPEEGSTTPLLPPPPATVFDKFVIKQGTTEVIGSNLEAGKEYTISQNGIVQAGYKVATGEAKFEVTIDGAGKYSVTAKDPNNDAYEFAINPDTGELTITVVNAPGENSLEVTPVINFNEVNEDGEERLHSLPLNGGAEAEGIFPSHNWAISYTNNDPTVKNLKLKVTLTQTFENSDHKKLDNILRFTKSGANDDVKEFVEGSEQTLYDTDELAKVLSTDEHEIKFNKGSKTGFFLDGAAINAAYQSGKIPIGTSDYEAKLTFTLASDPIQ